MNKKFEDLMYQTGLTAQGCWDEMDSYDRQSIEKFAELIVRNCIDWCNAHATIDGTAQKIVESIKKDFGVQE